MLASDIGGIALKSESSPKILSKISNGYPQRLSLVTWYFRGLSKTTYESESPPPHIPP